MHTIGNTLEGILRNNAAIDFQQVKEVLVLFDYKGPFFIGDNCLRLYELRICKLFFNNAAVHLNFNGDTRISIYNQLLVNNPFIDHISNDTWEQIDFSAYEVIICISQQEKKLLELIHGKYPYGLPEMAVFSSTLFFFQDKGTEQAFPLFWELQHFSEGFKENKPVEIFISQEEKQWGNTWLEQQGVQPHERVFIVLDSSSRRKKLLRMAVYFELLGQLLEMEDVKVLIFDEKNIGKEQFYKEWLTVPQFNKIIFSVKENLREAFSLISSDYTRMILGPCTGLIHCASGIFNNFTNNHDMPLDEVPVMITYTGKYTREDETANRWWHNAPLVDCLVIRKTGDKKTIMRLKDMSEEEKKVSANILNCDEYETKMLMDYLNNLPGIKDSVRIKKTFNPTEQV